MKERGPRGLNRPAAHRVKLLTISGNGVNGPGYASLPGAELGDVVLGCIYVGGGAVNALGIETEIGRADYLHQTGPTDYSGGPFIVVLGEP